MPKFNDTNTCQSRLHCNACRNDSAFRASLVNAYGEFDCPLGIAIDSGDKDLPMPKTPVPVESICKYRGKKIRDANTHRPCRGGVYECLNDDNQNDFIEACDCRKVKCRFFMA